MSLVNKFFEERELSVMASDKTGAGSADARDWFNAVAEAVAELPKYEHDSMGLPRGESQVNLPASTNDMESGVWFFRGQKDASYAFNSTLYRRLLDATSKGLLVRTPKDHEKAMVDAEIELLSAANKIGIGRGLTPLETLTLLQHHGSPTRLIDVTSDWRVALFFACEGDDDTDGRVFFVKINPHRWQDFPKAKRNSEQAVAPVWQDYRDNFPKGSGMVEKYSWLSGTWPILLPFSDPRMISQQGFFLVGGVPSLKGKAQLQTSKCEKCDQQLCTCGSGAYGRIESPLDTQSIREIVSVSIRFGADKKQLSELTNVKFGKWTAIGYSVRVPKKLKRELREILHELGLYTDSIYPPLRETVRLFAHIVTESFGGAISESGSDDLTGYEK